MDELIKQFAVEARELVEQASDDLLALEKHPDDLSHLESLFRAVHTLKGLSGLFGAARMAGLSHELEDVLDELRLGRVEL